MLSFNFDASKGETPASIAQKRALIAQLMGSVKSPTNLGEGFSALGDGIVANVEGGRAREAESKGQASANSTFSALTGMLTGQGGRSPSSAPAGGSDFMTGLINSESGGNWGALNSEGYGGRLQFGDARLADAAAAGIIPPGVTGAAFSRMSPEEQQAVEAWHFADIDKQAADMGLSQYFGQTIGGVPINAESIRAMSHLGGIGGAQKFITSGGQYNPADSNGTRLSDYGSRFGSISQPSAPVQVASLDPSIGMPAAPQQAQLPPIAPSQPQQIAQAAPMPPQAPAAAAPAPIQTAQGPSLQMLMEAAANPWLNESQKAIINTMISEQMRQQDPAYQMGLEKSQIELEALRNPGKKPPIEVGGVLVDPDTFQPVFDSRSDTGFTLSPGQQRFDAQGNPIASGAPAAAPRPMSAEDRSMWGIPETDRTPYYLDENGQPKAIGGGGVNVTVGGQGEIGSIPPDYELITDPVTGARSMQIIPGSPSDRKAQAEAAAAQGAADASQNQASRYGNVVVEDIDRALGVLEKDPTWSTGILGQGMGLLKGSNSDRLNNLLDTVRANSAFDRLQAMRDASPTGGALGAVSERELGLLQSAIGSLETGNAEDLAYNLKRLQTIYSEIIDGPKAATPAPNQSQSPAGIDALLEKYR